MSQEAKTIPGGLQTLVSAKKHPRSSTSGSPKRTAKRLKTGAHEGKRVAGARSPSPSTADGSDRSASSTNRVYDKIAWCEAMLQECTKMLDVLKESGSVKLPEKMLRNLTESYEALKGKVISMTMAGVPGQGKSTFLNKLALSPSQFDNLANWGELPLPAGAGGATRTKRFAQLDFSNEPYIYPVFLRTARELETKESSTRSEVKGPEGRDKRADNKVDKGGDVHMQSENSNSSTSNSASSSSFASLSNSNSSSHPSLHASSPSVPPSSSPLLPSNVPFMGGHQVEKTESLFTESPRIDIWAKAIGLREKKLKDVRLRKEYQQETNVTPNMQLLADMEAMHAIVSNPDEFLAPQQAKRLAGLRLGYRWQFGPLFSFKDTRGWDKNDVDPEEREILTESNVVICVSQRVVAEEGLALLIKHGAFNDPAKAPFLCAVYHAGNDDNVAELKGTLKKALISLIQDASVLPQLMHWDRRAAHFHAIISNAVLFQWSPDSQAHIQLLHHTRDKVMMREIQTFQGTLSTFVFVCRASAFREAKKCKNKASLVFHTCIQQVLDPKHMSPGLEAMRQKFGQIVSELLVCANLFQVEPYDEADSKGAEQFVLSNLLKLLMRWLPITKSISDAFVITAIKKYAQAQTIPLAGMKPPPIQTSGLGLTSSGSFGSGLSLMGPPQPVGNSSGNSSNSGGSNGNASGSQSQPVSPSPMQISSSSSNGSGPSQSQSQSQSSSAMSISVSPGSSPQSSPNSSPPSSPTASQSGSSTSVSMTVETPQLSSNSSMSQASGSQSSGNGPAQMDLTSTPIVLSQTSGSTTATATPALNGGTSSANGKLGTAGAVSSLGLKESKTAGTSTSGKPTKQSIAAAEDSFEAAMQALTALGSAHLFSTSPAMSSTAAKEDSESDRDRDVLFRSNIGPLAAAAHSGSHGLEQQQKELIAMLDGVANARHRPKTNKVTVDQLHILRCPDGKTKLEKLYRECIARCQSDFKAKLDHINSLRQHNNEGKAEAQDAEEEARAHTAFELAQKLRNKAAEELIKELEVAYITPWTQLFEKIAHETLMELKNDLKELDTPLPMDLAQRRAVVAKCKELRGKIHDSMNDTQASTGTPSVSRRTAKQTVNLSSIPDPDATLADLLAHRPHHSQPPPKFVPGYKLELKFRPPLQISNSNNNNSNNNSSSKDMDMSDDGKGTRGKETKQEVKQVLDPKQALEALIYSSVMACEYTLLPTSKSSVTTATVKSRSLSNEYSPHKSPMVAPIPAPQHNPPSVSNSSSSDMDTKPDGTLLNGVPGLGNHHHSNSNGINSHHPSNHHSSSSNSHAGAGSGSGSSSASSNSHLLSPTQTSTPVTSPRLNGLSGNNPQLHGSNTPGTPDPVSLNGFSSASISSRRPPPDKEERDRRRRERQLDRAKEKEEPDQKLTITLSAELDALIRAYSVKLKQVPFGLQSEESEQKCLFPWFTLAWVRKESDIDQFVHNDYDGLSYLGFYLVEPSQVEMFAVALRDRPNVIVVALPYDNMKPEFGYDIGKHIAEHYGFQYTWRLAMNLTKAHELQPELMSVRSCSRARLMYSMQLYIFQVFNSMKRRISEFLHAHVNEIIFNLMSSGVPQDLLRTVLPTLTTDIHDESARARMTDSDIEPLTRVMGYLKDELKKPYLDIVTAYTGFSMLTTYPSQFVLYTILPNFPKLFQVRSKSQMMNTLVLNHTQAQEGIWYASQHFTDRALRAAPNELCRRDGRGTGAAPVAKPPPRPNSKSIAPIMETMPEPLAPPIREFCQEARDAEKRFSGITYRSFRNLRQLLCASFGFEFSKY